MQTPSLLEISPGHSLIQVRDSARNKITNCVHQTGCANRQHREAQLLQTHENSEVSSESCEQRCNQPQVVRRLLDPDQRGQALGDLSDRLRLEVDRCAAWNVIEKQRQVRATADVEVVLDQPSLRRAD